MDKENAWAATRSGRLAFGTRLEMDQAVSRWKIECDPQRRFRILLEYSVLMGRWLDQTRAHLRELEMGGVWPTDRTLRAGIAPVAPEGRGP